MQLAQSQCISNAESRLFTETIRASRR